MRRWVHKSARPSRRVTAQRAARGRGAGPGTSVGAIAPCTRHPTRNSHVRGAALGSSTAADGRVIASPLTQPSKWNAVEYESR